ncbi:hypothetical protein [Gloeothece verrucosa]|uniref:Uncharacterized protein n=1 Tax=Gloeothece verrucosa (strain PCC 7822) TaxID=497965 RepID=E0UKK5_GLOV7|nr:hypothetical protein [Gloeothece verrucosa]ADN17485.1 conserved hypothetical protein [Gloeothece verrucosa PCC 7822]
MSVKELLNLKKPQDYPSKEAYKQDVLKAVELLIRLGINESGSADLKSSIESVTQKLQEDEEQIHGKKRSKQEILEDLKQVNSEITELDLEIADLERQIAIKKAKKAIE